MSFFASTIPGLDMSNIYNNIYRPDIMIGIATAACLLCGLIYLTCFKSTVKKPNWKSDNGRQGLFPMSSTEMLLKHTESTNINSNLSGINFKYPPIEAEKYKKFRANFLNLDDLNKEDIDKLERLLMNWASEVFYLYVTADDYKKARQTLSHSSPEYIKIMDTLVIILARILY